MMGKLIKLFIFSLLLTSCVERKEIENTAHTPETFYEVQSQEIQDTIVWRVVNKRIGFKNRNLDFIIIENNNKEVKQIRTKEARSYTIGDVYRLN